MSLHPRVWFITGASSGFGRCMTELVLKNGEIVVATLRKPETIDDLKVQYSPDRLLILKLDVTKPDEIAASFAIAKQAFGRIDVVFNNAGYTVLGEVESVPDDVARAMFDVNFWGAAHVSQEAIKAFRDTNQPRGGRLLNVSSMVGIKALPALGFYSAAKHALEGMSEGLAGDLDPEWNIRVTILELGGYRTKAGTESMVRTEQHSAYNKPALAPSVIRAYVANPGRGRNGSQDPNKASIKIFDLSLLQDPPLRLVLGKDAVAAGKAQVASFSSEIKKYEEWSENLYSED